MALLPTLLALTLAAPADAPAPARTADDPAPARTAGTAAAKLESIEAPAAPPPLEQFAGDPLKVRKTVLDNGFTVYLTENHERPEVFGAVVVRTGAKNDPADNTGMAHYLEHMLFKGTTELGTTNWPAEQPLQAKLEALYEQLRQAKGEQAKKLRREIADTVQQTYAYVVPNELDQLLEQQGGSGINAFTSYDETVYHNTFPASQIGPWLELYAHRFEDPVFRLFPTELEAVYEEKNIAIDTVGYELFRQFMRAAFPGHPYGTNDVLGEVEHLKKPSLRAMRAYFNRYYVPSNMALILSGDIDVERTLPLIQRTFGRWDRHFAPAAARHQVKPFRPRQRLEVRLSPIRVGAVAFHTAPQSDEDFAALQVARRLLTNEQRSGFIDRLADDGKVLLAVHVPADFADQNLDVVAYAPRLLTQTFMGAERAVLDQFEKLRAGEFDDASFVAVKEGLLAEEKLKWEDNRERALTIAHAFVQDDGWRSYLNYLQRLESLTRKDLVEASQRMFSERHLVVRSRMGFPKKQRLDKPKNPAVKPPAGAHSAYFERVQQMRTEDPRVALVDIDHDIRRMSLRDGMTLQASTNPFNDLYQLEFQFGVGDDRIRELGLLADYLPRTGSDDTPSKDFRRRLFAINTTITAKSTPDRFSVTLAGPSEHLGEGLDLMAELMRGARAETKPLRQLRREIWGYRRIDKKDPSFAGRALRDYVLYGDDSEYLRGYGPTSARSVSAERLVDVWQEVLAYAVDLRYVGPQRMGEVGQAIAARIPSVPDPRAAVAPVVYARRLPQQPTVYFLPRRDAVQSQLWFAVEGEPVDRSQLAAAEAFDEYLGGSMAGLVFQEIREFRALAYSAYADYRRDVSVEQKSHLVGYVGCQADKTMEALGVMVDLISNMPRKPERIDLVRRSLLRNQETQSPSFRELHETVETWTRHGYDEDPRTWLRPSLESISFEQVMQFYERNVAGRPLAIMVVGDPRKIDREALAKYGKVVRVREGALYSP